jgi:ferredoxin-like protein FixX
MNWQAQFDEKFELRQQGCMECGGDSLIDLEEEKINKDYLWEDDLLKIKTFIQSFLRFLRI